MNQTYPLPNLQLAGWLLSARVSRQKAFLRKLETFYWQLGGEDAHNPISAHCPRSIFGLALAERDLRFRPFYPEGVSFVLSGLSKTSHPGQDPKERFHANFPDDQDLCPVACLREYEARSPVHSSTLNSLFLSYTQPHKPVSSATLAR